EDIAGTAQLLERFGDLRALLGDGLGGGRTDVEDLDLELPALEHVAGHRLTHFAAADKTNLRHERDSLELTTSAAAQQAGDAPGALTIWKIAAVNSRATMALRPRASER